MGQVRGMRRNKPLSRLAAEIGVTPTKAKTREPLIGSLGFCQGLIARQGEADMHTKKVVKVLREL